MNPYSSHTTPYFNFIHLPRSIIPFSLLISEQHRSLSYLYRFFTSIGYDRHEVLGCNWRFLSGVGTDSSVLNQVQTFSICLMTWDRGSQYELGNREGLEKCMCALAMTMV
jgi:hypothetical protein